LDNPSVSLICPAYDDEKNIGPLVRRCVDVMRGAFQEFEIIIVEDGSPDATGREADALAAEYAEVVAIHHEVNRGQGASLKTGLSAASYPVVAFMDGDGQYEPGDLPGMVARLADADLVQGRRRVYPNGRARAAMSGIYNFLLRRIFGVEFHDLGCSIKTFKKNIVEKALPEGDGIFMQGELVLRASRAGFAVEERDVACYERKYGSSHSIAPKNVLIMALEIMRLKREWKI